MYPDDHARIVPSQMSPTLRQRREGREEEEERINRLALFLFVINLFLVFTYVIR